MPDPPEPPGDAIAPADRRSGWWLVTTRRRVTTCLAVAGVAVVVFADRIAAAITRVMPAAGRTRGLGTNFDGFEVVGSSVVRRTGVVVVVSVVAVAIGGLADGVQPLRVRRRVRYLVQGCTALLVALWFGWLARPHNAYPSNSRFHWVDYLTFDSDNYFYAAGRLPHLLFYEVPFLWQAINAAMLVVVIAAISNRLRLPTTTSALMCLSPAVSTNLLLFADTAEDVLLNVTLLLGVVLALMHRRPVATGLALSLAVLGRPSFLLLAAALVAAEAVAGIRSGDRNDARVESTGRLSLGWLGHLARSVDRRFVGRTITAFVMSTAAFQLLFSLLGRRYLFTNGRIVDTGFLDDYRPIDVDGFFISPLSGAYFLHLLWVMPLVLLVGAVVAVALSQHGGRTIEATVYFCAFSVAGIVLVHELKPLGAYNIRYLTYVWPFLFVLAWIAFVLVGANWSRSMRIGALGVLVLGLTVLPVDPIARKRAVEERVETELLERRAEFDRLFGDTGVVITFGGRSTRNLLAYVINDDRSQISSVYDVELVPSDAWVITKRSEPLPDRDLAAETDSLLVYAPD